MRADRRGVALILVVLALAGVFALVMQLSLVSRSSQIESRVLIERLRDERDARAAAVIVLAGLGASTPINTARKGTGVGDADEPVAAAPAEPSVELPELVRELLRAAGKLDEIEGGAREVGDQISEAQRRAQPSPGVGDGAGTSVRFRSLRDIGLPHSSIRVPVGERVYAVTLRDAVGGLNINTALRPQLIRYFEFIGLPSERAGQLAEQIIHWREPAANPLPNSAEADHYRRLGVVVRNAEINALEELLYLPAMDRDLFERIRGDLCLTGDAVHAGSASEAVLRSMEGVPETMIDRILERRAEFRLTPTELQRLMPPGNHGLEQRLRAEPMNFLEIIVQRTDPPGPAYRGLAVIGDRNIAAFGLKLD